MIGNSKERPSPIPQALLSQLQHAVATMDTHAFDIIAGTIPLTSVATIEALIDLGQRIGDIELVKWYQMHLPTPTKELFRIGAETLQNQAARLEQDPTSGDIPRRLRTKAAAWLEKGN